MKRVIAVVILAVLGAAFSFAAAEKVELLTTEYSPFCSEKGGMWCDLVNAAFAREGVEVTWKGYPQDREKTLVADGTNVAFLSGTLVISQEEKPSFTLNENPLIYASIVAFFPKAKYPSGLGVKAPADLKGKTVGVVRGTGSVSVLQTAGANLDMADDKDLLIRKLEAGRYDIAVIADLTGLGSLQSLFPDKINNYKYELVYNSPIDLIFSKKAPNAAGLKAKYDSGIAKIKADGTFLKILARYYPNGQINKSILTKDMQ